MGLPQFNRLNYVRKYERRKGRNKIILADGVGKEHETAGEFLEYDRPFLFYFLLLLGEYNRKPASIYVLSNKYLHELQTWLLLGHVFISVPQTSLV